MSLSNLLNTTGVGSGSIRGGMAWVLTVDIDSPLRADRTNAELVVEKKPEAGRGNRFDPVSFTGRKALIRNEGWAGWPQSCG